MSSQRAAPWVLVSAGIHNKGGQDKANYAVAEYLLDNGNSVHLVSHSVDSNLAAHSLVTLHAVPRPPGPYFLCEQVLDTYARALAKRITGENPSARVLLNGGNCLWPGINWSHYVHSAWKTQLSGAPGWYRLLSAFQQRRNTTREARAYRNAQLILTNSNDTRDHILSSYGVDPSRIRTVHLGCDPSWGAVSSEERALARAAFALDPTDPVAVFVGGIGWDDRKGFDAIVEVWRELARRASWKVKLLVAGTGPALSKWQARVRELGLSDRIHFLGFTRQVKQLLAAADILLSPARYEPYGLNVQEAICRGVPAMVSACAGVAERYPKEAAGMLLQNPSDVSEFAGKLERWNESMALWQARFETYGAQFRGYTWNDMAKRMVKTVDEELEMRPERSQVAVP